jgi:aminoglycoside 6'-N-acetyltransferase I
VAGASSRYGLEIRAATAADAPFLAELLASTGRTTSAPVVAERLEALRRDGACLVASDWGPLSGVVVLHWAQPLQASRTAHVSLILVAVEARRRGVGRMLLKAGSQTARSAGCDLLQIVARSDTPDLDAFCRGTGFQDAGRLWTRPLRKRS